jgi:hypothetical protein
MIAVAGVVHAGNQESSARFRDYSACQLHGKDLPGHERLNRSFFGYVVVSAIFAGYSNNSASYENACPAQGQLHSYLVTSACQL